MAFALPHLLFQECHNYCVNNADLQVAQTEGEKTCISNCQQKTYRAFDLYLQVQSRVAAKKSIKSYIDISNYTGMEVEHSHDTASVLPRDTGHVSFKETERFLKQVNEDHGHLKREAL